MLLSLFYNAGIVSIVFIIFAIRFKYNKIEVNKTLIQLLDGRTDRYSTICLSFRPSVFLSIYWLLKSLEFSGFFFSNLFFFLYYFFSFSNCYLSIFSCLWCSVFIYFSICLYLYSYIHKQSMSMQVLSLSQK